METILGLFGGLGLMAILPSFVITLLVIASVWKVFNKAGEKGWKCLIPIYNGYIDWKISLDKEDYIWLMMLGVISFFLAYIFSKIESIGYILQYIIMIPWTIYALIKSIEKALHLAKRFGKTKPFAIFLLFIFPIIGYAILAWGNAVYSAERDKTVGHKKTYFSKLRACIRRDRWLYLLLLPGFIYFVVFKYLPMFGIVIAFENYVPYSGVLGSQWVGLKWFEYFFKFPAWVTYLTNTLILSLMNIIFYFPAPIILALLLNEMRSLRYKKLLQTLLYVPHFISIVIVVSITFVMFGTSGIVYKLTEQLLGHPINYMGSPDTFRWMIIGQTIWKETGWGTIIFLAALTNVDTQLYEAAMVDGAGRLRRLWHITLPAIRSTIVLMLILRMGSVLDTGADHLILMANPLNRKVSQTLDVFVYQQGIQSGQFSYASAIGLMKAVVSITLVVTSNKIAHLLGEQGLY